MSIMSVDSIPPLFNHYGTLLATLENVPPKSVKDQNHPFHIAAQLPVIDISPLRSTHIISDLSKSACVSQIVSAASEWGFFQVVNHGVRPETIRRMRSERSRAFKAPFERKASHELFEGCYSWGSPSARSPKQFSWSECFHIPVHKMLEPSLRVSRQSEGLREAGEEFSREMLRLGKCVLGVLCEGAEGDLEDEIWGGDGRSCYLRLNRYPPCLVSPEVFGLVPHTDSDFLTILDQDQVGGLQLKTKDSVWLPVNPCKEGLIVNVGDLLQAWSNDVYNSVEHRVMANAEVERYSTAYFMCPENDVVIGSSDRQHSLYRNFTFGDYRAQTKQDVMLSGHKVGLPRFLLNR